MDEELTEEELEHKAATICLVEKVCLYFTVKRARMLTFLFISHQQIWSYFNNKCNQLRMKNLFSLWLANLWKPVGLAPKAKPDHQFYMRHPQYREKVAEEY